MMTREQLIERVVSKHRKRIEDVGLLTGEVAELCKTSEATIKRWADAGRIVAKRSPGQHRFFAIDDVLALVEKRAAKLYV